MSRDELVSIILPTYNRAEQIEECVRFVLAQSYSNWELIISDDGSTDSTPLIAKKLTENDGRIRYHQNRFNQGLPKNKSIAISASRGDLVFIIEDDLILEPDCLEILVSTYSELKAKGCEVGAIVPRLTTQFTDNVGTLRGIFRGMILCATERGGNCPGLIDKRTGFIYEDYDVDFDEVKEIEMAHACLLYPKVVFRKIGGFSDSYKGNYNLEFADFNLRVREQGYGLYFQSKAVMLHKIGNTGGCYRPLLSYGYSFIKNRILFTRKHFGLKALYMIPGLLLFLSVSLIRYLVTMLVNRRRTER